MLTNAALLTGLDAAAVVIGRTVRLLCVVAVVIALPYLPTC